MTINLGQVPEALGVTLVEEGDFIGSITNNDDPATGIPPDWPAGLVVTIKFNDPAATVFTATVTGPTIAWNVDKALVNTLIAAAPKMAWLNYKDGARDIPWARGRPTIVRL